MSKIKLDKDEKEILESFERGEWKSVQNVKGEIMKHQHYARNTLKGEMKPCLNEEIPGNSEERSEEKL